MKLLLDANLSWRMVAVLKQQFDDCFHVDSIGVDVPARDSEIWDYARKNNLIIVTNDEDFIDFMNVKGFPPKVILLKTGNQSRLFITNLLISRKNEILVFSTSSEVGLLEIVSP
jgi:predicted nuclease of predicted toxin-antitoxin system